MLPSFNLQIPLPALNSWLDSTYGSVVTPPIYSSVDVRISNYKAAAVDTNLFPAGFNNLHSADFEIASTTFANSIRASQPGCRRILLVPEEHTRNLWYLENIAVLSRILENSGFEVTIATFLDNDPEYCANSDQLIIRSATGTEVRLNCLHRIIQNIRDGVAAFDLAILNNDLSTGIPTVLTLLQIPIAPPPQAGWHQRHKSDHFNFTRMILDKAAAHFKFDPWLLRCEQLVVDNVDVTLDVDRQRLADATTDLFSVIADRYKAHQISDKPLVFLKSDSGTYGMGVMPIEDPRDIVELNRKGRNKLHKGKGSQLIHRFILQEGVPSALTIDGMASEHCIYQVGTEVIGGFYRQNNSKSERDNLNSQGMQFAPFIWKAAHSLSIQDPLRTLCAVVAKTAAYAAGLEIDALQRKDN